MEGFSLKSRAIVFAVCAGAVTFILAMLAGSHGRVDAEGAAQAVIVAIICAVLCWASAERTIAATAGAVDAAIARLSGAAKGDLESPIPAEVSQCVPPLAEAMDGLFRQLHLNLEQVQRLALYDPVTGLANRTNFRRTAEEMIADMAPGADAALYFIDLDRFKAVNDNLGHAAGDALLAMVAHRLRAVAERHAPAGTAHPPLIGRLSGDEFTLLFAAVPSVAAADRIGHAILDALTRPFDVGDRDISIGASIGVALRPRHGASLTELMRAADAAMYHAKARGRGRTERFSDRLAEEIAGRARLETDLRAAIDQDQFALVFQPQVAAASGAVVGAEALLRWRHPDGLKLPDSFLQRAEESGLIVEIGDWVVRSVARTIAHWDALGVEQRLAVNISPRQIDQASFFRRLREALRVAGAPAHLLELEISEVLAMRCSDEVLDAIAALRADGASIAIDDFGTGYSNLARLRNLPIDRIKLDHSLVEHVVARHESRIIAQAVIGLIHGLNCEAVAEGIETLEQAEVLRVIGCDVLQGYAVGQPMDEAVFLDWARDMRRRAIRA